MKVATAGEAGYPLNSLLEPFYVKSYEIAETLKHITVKRKVVVTSDTLDIFVAKNGVGYRMDLIAWGYQGDMGVDFSFFRVNETNNEPFVSSAVFQVEGGDSHGIRNFVLTLSRGLQYLPNSQRIAILNGHR